ncbi:helix-turn-helix domain-containing protein [Solitalea sp. MAHUQ-68]|uniref:Helix-turn-helix domain-containing protein n=2 Tax=Sphingobacteriaceae TaxID=84566 RepID=A0A9X2JD43_9SPHI|nr:helix-turn-helix domain-containing protein [Solitalea agri]
MIRIKKGLSQHGVALRLNISQNAYWKIENGETGLSIDHLLSLADTFDIPASTLLESLEIEGRNVI